MSNENKVVLPEPVQDKEANATSKEEYRRMFIAACSDLGLINEALDLDPDDGGAEPILEAIAELKALASIAAPAAVSVPKCPFPCGWENLHKLAVAEGAFLANSLREDEPLTEHRRDTVMRVVNYSIEMARAALAATPAAEPFGYFKAEPFGWTDCGPDDEGAVALYEKPQALLATGGQAQAVEQPRLTVRLTSFPEFNGKRNWTAMFKRTGKFDGLIGNAGGITIARGECWNRVAYHAEEARFLLGERGTEPDIMAYGDDVHTPQEWSGEDADGVFAAIAAAKGE